MNEKVGLVSALLGDPGAVIQEQVNSVLIVVGDPVSAVEDDIDAVKGVLESVKACLE